MDEPVDVVDDVRWYVFGNLFVSQKVRELYEIVVR